MTLLIHDTKLVFHHLTSQIHSGIFKYFLDYSNIQYNYYNYSYNFNLICVSVEFAVIVLYGTTEKGEVTNGLTLAQKLRTRLTQDIGLLAFPVVGIDTVLCLDHCSGKSYKVKCHKSFFFNV